MKVNYNEEYLTIDEAAAFLKVRHSYLYEPKNRANIPYIKKGNLLRFRKSDLIKYLESGLVFPKRSLLYSNKNNNADSPKSQLK